MKVLGTLAKSPAACSFSMALGIGVLLSVAHMNPLDSVNILLRQAIGGVFLLLPSIVNRFMPQDY